MSGCSCSWCSSNRTIGVQRQNLPEGCQRARTKKYPKRTKKIWDDRIKAQENVIKRYQEYYDSARKRKETGRGWGSPGMYLKWLDREKIRLEKIKTQASKFFALA